jgi:predicted nucleic acid-binding protein
MDESLIDTDILNEILKRRNPTVVQRAATYLAHHGTFTFSAITRYEIARGLKELRATAQLARFDVFCQRSTVLPVSEDVLD